MLENNFLLFLVYDRVKTKIFFITTAFCILLSSFSFGQNTISVPFDNGFVGVNFAINTFLTERIEETISGYNAAVVINLYGKNLDTLDQDAIKVAQMLETLPGSKDIMLQSPPNGRTRDAEALCQIAFNQPITWFKNPHINRL